MDVIISDDAQHLGARAGADAAAIIRRAIADRGRANMIVATGASQFATLDTLVAEPDVDWSRVTGFHLDEYIGLGPQHPASFCGYLRQRLVDRVPLAAFHYINGLASDPHAECARVGAILREHPIDVALVGIGENGHLAFNDPPADFDAPGEYIVVDLDEACRRQQWGEGWFESLEAVPTRAISMTVGQIMRSAAIVCSVPDARKAEAVRGSIDGPVTPDVPASILQRHAHTTIYLDAASAGARVSAG
ncbi:MAG: glucosamine-6-phosphate deaminase [Phycisphaera sp.]|nr:glucosamine-6-phosphate deaminase [Phycisphaera sp.]